MAFTVSFKSRPILSTLIACKVSPVLSKLLSIIFSIITGALLTHFEPWKSSNIRTWTSWIQEGCIILVPGIGATIFSFAGEGMEKVESEGLEDAKAEIKALTLQLTGWVRIAAQVREIIDKKKARLLPLLKNPCKIQFAFSQLINKEQPEFILKMIYFHFRHSFTGSRLRLALFGRNRDVRAPAQLTPLYSWDGQQSGCISIEPQNFTIDDANCNRSEVAKLYLSGSHHSFKVIPDCSKHPDMIPPKREEINHLKSMLLFKHVFHFNGMEDAFVLCVDCDVTDHFNAVMKEEYKQFLIEMLTRIEYELIALQLYQKFYPQKTP